MLEYYDENIWYIKKKKRKGKKGHKKALTLFFLLIIIFGIYFYYKNNVTKNIINYCQEYSNSASTEVVNKAILSVFSAEIGYKDLINVEKNSQNEIIMLSANAQKINLLSGEMVSQIKSNLTYLFALGIPIPSMTFSGIKIFSGYGREINFKSVNISSVECEFYSQFKSVGINQTLHSIKTKIICCLDVGLFLNEKTIVSEQEVLISETVLVGKIPEIYLNNGVIGGNIK